MKKTWRWPLAGFVLGGLVGATFLTVNVVGASSPEPDGVTVSSFGEILHTPPLLAEAGQPVELSYDVVCGADEGRARRDVLAEGLCLRPRVRGERLRRAPARAGARRASVRGGLGRERRIRLLRRARQRPRRDRDAARGGCRCPAARLAAPELDDGRPGSGALRRDEVALVGRLGAHLGQGRARRSGSTAARSSRGSGRRHSTSLQTAPSSCSTR